MIQKEVEVQPIVHCSDMLAIGSYFVLIMSVMGTPFAVPTFSVEESDQFFEKILQKHNLYRENHGADPLFLNRLAIDGAKKNMLEWIKNTSNVPNQPGVNTFSTELSENSKLDAKLADEIVDKWYNTGEGYNYDVGTTVIPNNADPFTQIVWKNSVHFGAALGVDKDKLYVLAYYIPKGNQINEYIANVPKLK